MKILIYTPVLRLFGQAVHSHLQAIDYSRGNFVIDHWLDYQPDDPEKTPILRCYDKYHRAQVLALKGDYDVLITLEDDILIPTDGIERLMRVLHSGADIAYGLYVWRHGYNHRWSAYQTITDTGGKSWSDKPYDSVLRPAWEQRRVIEVAGVGLGFTAISRKALENIPFMVRGKAAPDWYLAVDAQRMGFSQRCDLGCVCGHMTMEPSPRIYWPDLNHDDKCRTDFLP